MATPTTPGFSPSTPPAQPLPSSGPQQPQGGPPEAQGQGLQQAAPPVMVLISNWGRVAGEIGQHYSQIADKMNTIQEQCRVALTTLAREQTQGQQQASLPTQAAPTAQPQPAPAGY